MTHTACIIVAAIVACLTPTTAFAQARHERVQIAAVRSGGQVTGARISLTLRPGGAYNKVALVLGRPMPLGYRPGEYRQVATKPEYGYALHRHVKIAVTDPAQKLTLEITYGQGNKLVSGAQVELATIWETDDTADAVHVWGMTRRGSAPELWTLP